MGSYNPPVAGLLKLGEPSYGSELDYTAFGIGPEHIPDLIRMLHDKELLADEPQWYAHIHAWRALAQLRAEAAIEPLLDLLAEQEGDDWDDWVTEEVPRVLGSIGPAAIGPTASRLIGERRLRRVPGYFAEALTQIAQTYPETREVVVNHLCSFLSHAADNDPSRNGFVIANLLDLDAEEAWLTIEAAFATGNVDEMVAGDAAHVKYELGLGPQPPPRRYTPLLDVNPADGSSAPGFGTIRQNAKQRFNERQRQKKLEKKANKKKRKGK